MLFVVCCLVFLLLVVVSCLLFVVDGGWAVFGDCCSALIFVGRCVFDVVCCCLVRAAS